jgi:hypothetical protein
MCVCVCVCAHARAHLSLLLKHFADVKRAVIIPSRKENDFSTCKPFGDSCIHSVIWRAFFVLHKQLRNAPKDKPINSFYFAVWIVWFASCQQRNLGFG